MGSTHGGGRREVEGADVGFGDLRKQAQHWFYKREEPGKNEGQTGVPEARSEALEETVSHEVSLLWGGPGSLFPEMLVMFCLTAQYPIILPVF